MRPFFVFVLLLSFVGAGGAAGQVLDEMSTGAGAFYRFADPTDITVQVKVWGAVANPGFYEVRQGLSVSTLLSLAGGPQVTRTGRTRSTLTVRLYRPQLGSGQFLVIQEVTMRDRILLFEDDPALLNGDILVVEAEVKPRFGWRDALSIVTAAASLTLVTERIIRLTE